MATRELKALSNCLIPHTTLLTLHKCGELKDTYRSKNLRAKALYAPGLKVTQTMLVGNVLAYVRAGDGLPALLVASNVAGMALGQFGDAGTQFGIDTQVPRGARDTSTCSRLHMRR